MNRTKAISAGRAKTEIALAERRFEVFLAKHNDLYQEALRVEHMTLARRLIREGLRQEARQELRMAGGGPLFYRPLSAAPSTLIRAAIGLRRWIRN
jgi:hypothetical protein